MSNIDWDFISEREGSRILTGYVPDADGSKSGVTIATGFDLGARNVNDLAGLPQALIKKLTPYLGIKGAEAQSIAQNLKISDSQAKKIDEFSKAESTERLKSKWQAATGQSFDDLPKNEATVIASVAFQYGNLESETPNFWRQITTGDWDSALANLRAFGDNYPSRRNLEADYYLAAFTPEEQEAKKKFSIAPDQVDSFERLFAETERTRDLSNMELVDLVQSQIKEARSEPIGEEGGLGSEPTGTPQQIDLEEQDFSISTQPTEADRVVLEAPVKPIEKFDIVDDNMQIQRLQRKIKNAEEFDIKPPPDYKPDETPEQRAERLLTQDLEDAGPITQTLRRDQFGPAGAAMFAGNRSEIWKAAFEQVNPMNAFAEFVSDMMFDIDDVPGYDFASDPQLKGREDSMWRFYDSGSPAETARRLKRLDEDLYMQSVLAAGPTTGVQIAASLFTPTTALPIAPLRYMRSPSAIKRFAAGGAFTSVPVTAEQLILSEQNETRTLNDVALAAGLTFTIGATTNAAFGKFMAKGVDARTIAREKKLEARYGDGGFYAGGTGTAGAMLNPSRFDDVYGDDAARIRAEALNRDAAKETGTGLERLGWNPVLRMLKSNNPLVRGIVSQMVDMGGIMQKRVDEELAQDTSVESTFRATYLFPLIKAIREADAQYLAYRGVVAKDSDISRSMQIMGLQIKDRFNRQSDTITEFEFRQRVGRAMRRNDIDPMNDAASPFVNNAAKTSRELLDLLADQATRLRMFEEQAQRALASAKAMDEPDPNLIAKLERRIADIRKNGITVNTAESYLPRMYRIDKIEARSDEFKAILRRYANQELGLRGRDAEAYVDDIYDSITKSKPYIELDDAVSNLEDVIAPSGSKARELEIRDELIEEFLESDIEVILRHHTKTMGMDIELTRAFGSIDMKAAIDQITEEFQKMIAKQKDPVKKEALRKEMLQALKDVRGLRDRLRGTYGASKDPHAISSRFVRAMKSFNVLVGMGGATVSSIPDLARVVMVEGFKNSYGKGLKAAFRENARLLKVLRERELRQAGVAADAVLGLRAHAFADMGDVFGNRFAAERFLSQSTSVMFMLNGLNIWNQTLKEFAGTVTALRMSEAIMSPWNSLSKADKEKLLKNGIDQQMHRRMFMQIDRHGDQVDGEWLPNTDLWTDATARLKFRAALNQNVERIIITPGAGDRALWTSRELGSLMTQFKSFGQAATVRLLTSGLQERDGAFWQGAFLIVGLAAMVNEIKRKQYGIDRKETFDEKLINAVDRSGMLGYFMDINNAVEKLSNYGVGLRPALTQGNRNYAPVQAKIGAVFGPTASNVMNIGEIVKDVAYGNADQGTLDTLRFVTPFSNHPALDPVFDRIYNQAK